jgi:hypothetical protein
MEINKLSIDQIDEQIEIYKDRIETISEYISETDDNSIKNVLVNQRQGYRHMLILLNEEKMNRKIKNAMSFDSNININMLGTRWFGKFSPSSKKDSILIFYPNGVLKYENISSSWEVKEGKIIISINNGFATMYAKLENDKMIGNAINIQNQEWSFEYKKINLSDILNSFVTENEDEENKTNAATENQILLLGKKWSLKNYLLFESEQYNIEICDNGILKINDDLEGTWIIKSGRIIFRFNNIHVEYNGEFLQNKIFGLAINNDDGKEWIFTGELIPQIKKPENCKTLKIKSENRGFGLMASNNETWNNFKLLDNGLYFEDKDTITLTSVNGQIYKASKGELPWEATMYNRNIDEDKKYNDIYYGRNPNGGQFLIYRSKSNSFQNEITIGVLNVKSDGITFEVL